MFTLDNLDVILVGLLCGLVGAIAAVFADARRAKPTTAGSLSTNAPKRQLWNLAGMVVSLAIVAVGLWVSNIDQLAGILTAAPGVALGLWVSLRFARARSSR